MAYNHLDPSKFNSNVSEESPNTKSSPPELKIYQFFIFCVPILCTFLILFFFYLLYLRRRRHSWPTVPMQRSSLSNNTSTRAETGLKKEVREMLPIVVYTESFSVTDTHCSVCLGEYKAEERVQQLPACGHMFHMDCIDHWLSTQTTCPLCRLSVLSPSPSPSPSSNDNIENQPPSNLPHDLHHQILSIDGSVT